MDKLPMLIGEELLWAASVAVFADAAGFNNPEFTGLEAVDPVKK